MYYFNLNTIAKYNHNIIELYLEIIYEKFQNFYYIF